MKRLNATLAGVLALLLGGCLVFAYLTRDSRPVGSRGKSRSSRRPSIDTSLYDTARQLAPLTETRRERGFANQALFLSDHELDQAFASALREAASYRPPATGPLHDLIARIDTLKDQLAADQERVTELSKKVDSQELDLAKAQLALDQDDLADAQQDLVREGGDPHVFIQQEMQEHETTQKQNPVPTNAVPAPMGTLAEQVRAWLAFGSQADQITGAQTQADSRKDALSKQHQELEKQLTTPADPDSTQTADAESKLALIKTQSELHKSLAELDRRIQDCQQLSANYASWVTEVSRRRQSALHLGLESLAQIVGILLAAVLINVGVRRALVNPEKPGLQSLRMVATVAIQAIALVAILLVIFGSPTQLSTVVGLVTAGLTVVLGDFIVSFFGWFALIGKNGIRVGDWVEINGVSGEVIDIGLLKTMLLELGSGADTGHPTGRQVAFANSFALKGQFFNFSTTGQWLWDELVIAVPPTADPYTTAEEIRKVVEEQTREDAEKAGKDWDRVMSRYGMRAFSAKPAVDLRPISGGLEVVVRYITRAPERFAIRTKLFQVIVDLLHKPAAKSDA